MSDQAAPHRPENYYADADWAKYAQLRPHYPAEIFSLLSSYLDQYNPAKAGARRAIDYGSGSGVIVRDLLERCGVDQVLATDLNANALEEGQRILGPELGERYSTLAGRAGHLDPKDVPDESFDLVVSAEAAHWFDQEEWIKEAHRILRPGGTLCAWFYPFPAYILDCPAAAYPLWRMWLYIIRYGDESMPNHLPSGLCNAAASLFSSMPLPDSVWKDHVHVKRMLPVASVQAHYASIPVEALARNFDPTKLADGLRGHEATSDIKTATTSTEVLLKERGWNMEKFLGYISTLHFFPMEQFLVVPEVKEALHQVEVAVGGPEATFDVGWPFGAFFVTKK